MPITSQEAAGLTYLEVLKTNSLQRKIDHVLKTHYWNSLYHEYEFYPNKVRSGVIPRRIAEYLKTTYERLGWRVNLRFSKSGQDPCALCIKPTEIVPIHMDQNIENKTTSTEEKIEGTLEEERLDHLEIGDIDVT